MSIKAIDASSVHKITSGQVIIDLETGVKELVDNALDAGATSVEVKFQEYGLASFQVIDNGKGIKEEDWEGIALKHHTSKLQGYSDLERIDTLGFRGEALSSLCATSAELSMVTATKDTEPMGSVLSFTKGGECKLVQRAARPAGTTVTVRNLFESLPVRRKELTKNIKREFAKTIELLQAYALVRVNCRMVITNNVKGKITTHLHVPAVPDMATLFTTVFTKKVFDTTLPVEIDLTIDNEPIRVSGHISKPVFGASRSTNSKVYLALNKRPFQHTRLTKMICDTYRAHFTTTSPVYPVAALNFTLPPHMYDVNITPDKRTIYIHNEATLLVDLAEALSLLFDPFLSTYPVTNLSSDSHHAKSGRSSAMPSSEIPTSTEDEEMVPSTAPGPSGVSKEAASTEESLVREASEELEVRALSAHAVPESESMSAESEGEDEVPTRTPLMPSFVYEKQRKVYKPTQQSVRKRKHAHDVSANARIDEVFLIKRSRDADENLSDELEEDDRYSQADEGVEEEEEEAGDEVDEEEVAEGEGIAEKEATAEDVMKVSPRRTTGSSGGNGGDFSVEEAPSESPDFPPQEDHPPSDDEQEEADYEFKATQASDVQDITIEVNMDQIRQTQQSARIKEKKVSDAKAIAILEAASIDNKDSSSVEEILSRIVSKDDFLKMDVIGQFNLGFIIARRRSEKQDDLFIVDQHAADEKFNFERLQATTIIQSQPLIAPRALHLSAEDELAAEEHVDLLALNGFGVELSPDPPRVKLVSQPVSKNISFGVDDLEELLQLVRTGYHTNKAVIRPSKMRRMFASRACRSSVMIGKALDKRRMTQILGNMSSMDQPWACPHGRPTMRWLFNMSEVCGVAQPDPRDINWSALS